MRNDTRNGAGIHELSRRLVEESRAGRGRAEWDELARLAPKSVVHGLRTDAEKLAFWINVYNAAIQFQLREDARRYRHRGRFFARRSIVVAGKKLSFNAIEHGLLRRSMFGYSLGYIANPLPGRFEKRFRLEKRDPRVHFALNCGAVSCPPVAPYSPEEVDAQLDDAARGYLQAESRYDAEAGVVEVPRLLLWFRGDFGGASGVRGMLERYGVVPEGVAGVRVEYREYDWGLTLG